MMTRLLGTKRNDRTAPGLWKQWSNWQTSARCHGGHPSGPNKKADELRRLRGLVSKLRSAARLSREKEQIPFPAPCFGTGSHRMAENRVVTDRVVDERMQLESASRGGMLVWDAEAAMTVGHAGRHPG